MAMADLLRLATDLGFEGARTVLQAGNVVFRTSGQTDAALEARSERGIRDRFGIESVAMIRSRSEWAALVEPNPFGAEARDDPSHRLVHSLKSPPQAAGLASLAAWPGPERVAASGRDLPITYPEGIGRPKLTAARIDRLAGAPGTGRNWNTVLKILAAMEP